jgi:general secretion pathway protein D
MLAGTAILLVAAVSAQGRSIQESPPATTTLNGEMELAHLVDLCARRLNLDLEYEAGLLRDRLTIRFGADLRDDELWSLTNELLAARGFATVRRPGSRVLSIVKTAEAPAAARLESHEKPESGAGFLSVVLRAEHRDAKELVESIKPLLSRPSGTAQVLGTGRYMLVSDFRSHLDQIQRIKELVDVPTQDVVVERFDVESVKATELAATATAAAAARMDAGGRKLAGKLVAMPDGRGLLITAAPDEVGTWRTLLASLDRRASVETRTYTPRGFAPAEVADLVTNAARDASPRGAGDRWRLVVDDLTGSLLVTATPSEHAEISALLERLDAVPGGSQRQTRLFTIRNRPVGDLVTILADLIDAGVAGEDEESGDPTQGSGAANGEASGSASSSSLPAAARAQSTGRPVLPPGAVDVDSPRTSTPSTRGARSNGPASGPRRAVSSGRDSDGEPYVTMTVDAGTNTIAVVAVPRMIRRIEELIETLDVRQPQVLLEVMVLSLSDDRAVDLGVELTKFEIGGSTLFSLSSLFGLGLKQAGPAAPPVPTAGSGFSGSVLRPADFGVLVRALESLNRGRALNAPKLLVNNGESATLTSVLQQPILSTNASTTVATTSFGGTQDAGTTVTVRPQIAEGDHLILQYSVSVSNFVGDSADPALPPPRQQNALESVVTIPDGYTVAVGGLEINQDAQGTTQVPFIGDIPIVGEAFKNRSNNRSKVRFYVFLRAVVMRRSGFEDLRFLSDEAVAESGLDDGMPTVEPRLIR